MAYIGVGWGIILFVILSIGALIGQNALAILTFSFWVHLILCILAIYLCIADEEPYLSIKIIRIIATVILCMLLLSLTEPYKEKVAEYLSGYGIAGLISFLFGVPFILIEYCFWCMLFLSAIFFVSTVGKDT